MSEAKSKIFLKNLGVTQQVKMYTTPEEAGKEYITSKVSGTTLYVPVGDINDKRATIGRIKINGQVRALLNRGKPVYSQVSYTRPGTYNFTVPLYVDRIRYAICGGGSGAAGRGEYWARSGAGTGSSIGNISVGGATGGYVSTAYTNEFSGTQQQGGSPNGRKGVIMKQNWGYVSGTELKGGAGWALGFDAKEGSYGKGGNGRTRSGWGSAGGKGTIITGASGGYKTGYLDVTEGQVIKLTVGSGGYKYWRGDGNGANVDDGASGFVLIAWGGYI